MAAVDHKSLKQAMDRSGVTPKQLADSVGMSLGYTCDLLSGRRKLKRNPGLRRRIADALGVPLHWIETADSKADAA